jgi:hypothetical protein
MTLSLQEISDRLEIQDLLVNYASALENRNPDVLDEVFTEDANIDYSAMHGSKGDLAMAKSFLATATPIFAGSQLMIAPSQISIDGDTAKGRTVCHHPTLVNVGEGKTDVFFCGLWYHDRFVRTSKGWRISERVTERFYYHNLPPAFAFLNDEHGEDCVCTRKLAPE